ncbi:BgTH12-02923 [Blumeria graminis f. sp. triticale]|uniref:Bgt-3323 n=3 Tax=Blumeria graminis TaxID=34373 RepID=A0A061HJ83_BLUGR|nr:hypothetical protein BGT96224_3323 [Blumeria graminis f. sp. tritici 96224]CAD6503256.1 BgTH12-02923 [Blumeria graminis f. sp. triticale]VDB89255.1 Bgt-3323 [Blumeria graminis f. sp. tritici]
MVLLTALVPRASGYVIKRSGRSRGLQMKHSVEPESPHIGYYKTFARPVAKVLLMATFTYQVAYWTWVKLETDELKANKTAQLIALEKELTNLRNKPST